MLGKLMKYEWKSTWKLLVPANLLIVVMTFFACVTVRVAFDEYKSEAVDFAAVMIILMYILSMFVAMVGSVIYLIYHFYTSTYGDQGYLLHTLPVDKHHIIIAKVLVSSIWVLISSFLIYASVLFLFNAEEYIFEDLLDIVKYRVTGTYSDEFTMFSVIMALIALIVELLARVLKVTACISLGQLSSNHKLLTAIGFYYAIYVVQQIINVIYYAFLSFIGDRTGTWDFGTSWEYALIMGLIYTVVFYLLTWHVMEKKLNLD